MNETDWLTLYMMVAVNGMTITFLQDVMRLGFRWRFVPNSIFWGLFSIPIIVWFLYKLFTSTPDKEREKKSLGARYWRWMYNE